MAVTSWCEPEKFRARACIRSSSGSTLCAVITCAPAPAAAPCSPQPLVAPVVIDALLCANLCSAPLSARLTRQWMRGSRSTRLLQNRSSQSRTKIRPTPKFWSLRSRQSRSTDDGKPPCRNENVFAFSPCLCSWLCPRPQPLNCAHCALIMLPEATLSKRWALRTSLASRTGLAVQAVVAVTLSHRLL